MAKKVLIIDKSPLLRDYFKHKLAPYGFDVILAKNGADGLVKMRNQLPDLIIMDFYLPQISGLEFLEEKQKLKGTADIPVIMLSNNIDRKSIIKMGRNKILKILSKPIEIDLLFKAVGDLFNTKFDIDDYPCIIDIHLNDDILFIEIAEGLNKEKIELMKYRILELKALYDVNFSKILIIITNIEDQPNLIESLNFFMLNVLSPTEALFINIVVLTTSEKVNKFFEGHIKYKSIKLSKNFVDAIDHLGKLDIFAFGEEIDDIQKDIISASKLDKDNDSSLHLKFSNEKIQIQSERTNNERKFRIAVVDDDLSILEYMETVLSQTNWKIIVYENGRVFIDDIKYNKPDLLFLDLLMPKMSGFEVLETLSEHKIKMPIIVLTALANKESIIRARSFGITSYLTKPIKPNVIIHKAEEILKSNF